jgi:hypothetical protein
MWWGVFCFNCLSRLSAHETMDHVKQNLSRDLQPQFHTPPSHISDSLPAQMHETVIKKKLSFVNRFKQNSQFILVHAIVFWKCASLKIYEGTVVVTPAYREDITTTDFVSDFSYYFSTIIRVVLKVLELATYLVYWFFLSWQIIIRITDKLWEKYTYF